MKDITGKTIAVHDMVVIGADNGSTLHQGVVSKLTAKYVWVTVDYGHLGTYQHRREPNRVAKVTK